MDSVRSISTKFTYTFNSDGAYADHRNTTTSGGVILAENHVSSRLIAGGRRPIIDLANQSLLGGLGARVWIRQPIDERRDHHLVIQLEGTQRFCAADCARHAAMLELLDKNRDKWGGVGTQTLEVLGNPRRALNALSSQSIGQSGSGGRPDVEEAARRPYLGVEFVCPAGEAMELGNRRYRLVTQNL